jgi:hypothetical protein
MVTRDAGWYPAIQSGGWAIRPTNHVLLLLLSSFFVVSCSTGTPQPSTPQVVSVYSTSSAQPWLTELYDCAAAQSDVVLSRVSDSSVADLVLQIGEPAVISFGYQIDTEEILLVTQRQSPVQNLTLDDARALFMGLGDPSVQVWVYASDEDVQRVFDQFVMEGRSVTSFARVAVSPQQMSDTLITESDSVGILPRHWKAGDSREVFSVAQVPVLAMTNSEPQGVLKELIGCLQR